MAVYFAAAAAAAVAAPAMDDALPLFISHIERARRVPGFRRNKKLRPTI